jgi:hypothetical protein
LDIGLLIDPSHTSMASLTSFRSLTDKLTPRWLENAYGLPSPSELVSPGFLGLALSGGVIMPTSVATPSATDVPSAAPLFGEPTPCETPPSPVAAPIGVAAAHRTAATKRDVAVTRRDAATHLNPMPRAARQSDLPLLRLFPRCILRASREEFAAAKKTNAQHLSKELKTRLKELRRKELSCVYADRARHERINSMKNSSNDIEHLTSENEQLASENESLRSQIEAMKRLVGNDRH